MTLTDVLLLIIAISISIIAIKITFTFDINKYLESRKQDIDKKIKNYCTHMSVEDTADGIKMKSEFISPHGTTNWICQKCWLALYHINKVEESERMKELFKDTDGYIKQEKKFQKLLKKGGYL
jgi:hypothetical protein